MDRKIVNKKNMNCKQCRRETKHHQGSGWWICNMCDGKTVKISTDNTNKKKGHDRGFDASGEAHSKIAKGSNRSILRR
jgi:ribosomal protein L37AE/L43A